MDTADRKNLRRAALALLVCSLVLVAETAIGVEIAGVRFADRATIGGDTFVLNGAGIRRVTIFKIKVYVAGLYLRETTRTAVAVLRPDRAKYFVAVMMRDVSRSDSGPAFREGVERSAGADAAAIRSEIAAFARWMPSMRERQQLTAAFAPNVGVVVRSTATKQNFRGSVRFGTALFGMWIGPRAKDTDLRDALVSGQAL